MFNLKNTSELLNTFILVESLLTSISKEREMEERKTGRKKGRKENIWVRFSVSDNRATGTILIRKIY